MARPNKERRVEQLPKITYYKPVGVPLCELEEIVLTIEEMEAVRLADVEMLDQGEAAERMEISRPTFHRIINRAHQKIAQALWQGWALRIDGGSFRVSRQHMHGRQLICQICSHKWEVPRGQGAGRCVAVCPACQSKDVIRRHEYNDVAHMKSED